MREEKKEAHLLDIPVICGSTRVGRKTIRVAKFIHRQLAERNEVTTSLVDLDELDLPMMKERLRMTDDPPKTVQEWGRIIEKADGIVITTPEYNHGYPGVLKNAIDYLLPEYSRKPVGIVTVSSGIFGGVRCLEALRQSVFGFGGFPIPAELPVTKVGESFSEDGHPNDEAWFGRTDRFLDTMIWFTDAIAAKKLQDFADEEE